MKYIAKMEINFYMTNRNKEMSTPFNKKESFDVKREAIMTLIEWYREFKKRELVSISELEITRDLIKKGEYKCPTWNHCLTIEEVE